jgi:hypothetical protein
MKRRQEELVGSSPNKHARSAEAEAEEEEVRPSGQTPPQRSPRPRTFMSWNVNSTCSPHLLPHRTL